MWWAIYSQIHNSIFLCKVHLINFRFHRIANYHSYLAYKNSFTTCIGVMLLASVSDIDLLTCSQMLSLPGPYCSQISFYVIFNWVLVLCDKHWLQYEAFLTQYIKELIDFYTCTYTQYGNLKLAFTYCMRYLNAFHLSTFN